MARLTDAEIERLRDANSRVLDIMQECGAEDAKMYVMEHFIYAPDEATAQKVLDEAVAAGFGADSITPPDPRRPKWFVFLSKEIHPREEETDDSSLFLLSLCAKHGAEYDGWGCGIPPDDVPEDIREALADAEDLTDEMLELLDKK